MKRTTLTLVAACAAARDLEVEGKFDEAREALSVFWYGLGHEPRLDGLTDGESAQLLLRVGRLTGCLGAAKRVEGAQEWAKDLLGRASRLFESVGDADGAAEAQTAVALAYWREGAAPEAAAILDTVLSGRYRLSRKVVLEAILVRAPIHWDEGRYYDAAVILREGEALLDDSDPAYLRGSFHSARGSTYFFLAVATGIRGLLERGESDYIAAIVYYSDAGHDAYRASIENNLAYIYLLLGNLAAAHAHLDEATAALRQTGSAREAAQSCDTRARVFLAAGNFSAAEASASAAVESLSRGDASALLAEALTTRGVARARLGLKSEARADLHLAGEVASRVGDGAGEGRARLALFEELGALLTLDEAQAAYDAAARLLEGVQDASVTSRLRDAARALCTMTRERLYAFEHSDYTWAGFSFDVAVHNFKALWIERAMREGNGVVLRAAKLLRMTHQNLFKLLGGEFSFLAYLQWQKKPRTVQRRATKTRRSTRAVRVRASAARACCSTPPTTFLRIRLADGDDALQARGPRGGDSIIADLRAPASEDDLVIVKYLDDYYYGYLRFEGDSVTLEYGDDRGREEFANQKPGDVTIAGPVIAYAVKGASEDIRQLLPL